MFILKFFRIFLLSCVFIFGVVFCFPVLAKQLTPGITLDTDVRFQAVDVDNADLGTNDSKNIKSGAFAARFKLTGNLSKNVLIFWEGRGVANIGRRGFQSVDTGEVSGLDSFLELRQSYLQFDNVVAQPVSLRIGRQKIREDYGIWWKQNFDSLRLTYDTTLFKGSLIAGQDLFSYRTSDGDFTENEQKIARVLVEGSWQYYYENFFEARLMFQDDHSGIAVGDSQNVDNPDDRDGRLFWGGVRASGKTHAFMTGADKPSYRVDLMAVTGKEDVATINGVGVVTAVDNKNVKGWAFDAGVDIPLPKVRPVLHLGYAFGSGDGDTTDDSDRAFRQTDLEGNFSSIGALSESTNNYGTVLRPQLTNIHVVSAGITMPVLKASNVGIIYRYYRLDEQAVSLVSSGINNTLDGVNRELGQGVDILFNMNILKERQINSEYVQDVVLRSSLGFFRSGKAYGTEDGEVVVRGLAELKIGF